MPGERGVGERFRPGSFPLFILARNMQGKGAFVARLPTALYIVTTSYHL